MDIKRADWVTCQGSSTIGTVKRLARDGSWADVNWHSHTKRMPTWSLKVHTTIPFSDRLMITDVTRERERKGSQSSGDVLSNNALVILPPVFTHVAIVAYGTTPDHLAQSDGWMNRPVTSGLDDKSPYVFFTTPYPLTSETIDLLMSPSWVIGLYPNL